LGTTSNSNTKMQKQLLLTLTCFCFVLTNLHVSAQDTTNNTIVRFVTCNSSSMTVTIDSTPFSFIFSLTTKDIPLVECASDTCTFSVPLTNIVPILGPPGNVTIAYQAQEFFEEQNIDGRTYFDAICEWTYSDQSRSASFVEGSNFFYIEAKNYLNYTLRDGTTGADPATMVNVGDDVTFSVSAMRNGAGIQDIVPYDCYWTNTPRKPTPDDKFVRLTNQQCPYVPGGWHSIKFNPTKLDDNNKAYVVCDMAFCLAFNKDDCGRICNQIYIKDSLAHSWQVMRTVQFVDGATTTRGV